VLTFVIRLIGVIIIIQLFHVLSLLHNGHMQMLKALITCPLMRDAHFRTLTTKHIQTHTTMMTASCCRKWLLQMNVLHNIHYVVNVSNLQTFRTCLCILIFHPSRILWGRSVHLLLLLLCRSLIAQQLKQ
jgi:hypothetical protein